MRFFVDRKLPPHLARLHRLALFATLDARELRLVEGLLHERSYLAGEVVFDEGEEGQALYIVYAGEVLICRQGQPETGRIALLEPGSFFGDLALLDNTPRAAQARAVSASTLGVLFRSDFMKLLETDARTASKVALQLARHIGRRLRDTVVGDHKVVPL
ncbi:MAG: cyclic nucleotide-binding domain-containing protein [Proteobacteria bacterium]|nr:cyclic nucleotide-binding domain-containing protein [Pseudomonadota bacterium]HQR02699.1 cyclic nucleotide-binding domain-containing protein [Rhodocyclaceae bacterium]